MALTKEQRQKRKEGLGGSDAAAICGLSKFKTPYGVYLEKTGELEEENLIDNPFLTWGNRLENVIADYFAEKHGVKLVEHNTRWHPEHKFMLANIDRFIENENAILEIKTTDKFFANRWGEEGTDAIPTEYLFQCCHYAAVYGVEKVFLIVLIGGNQPKEYIYSRNEELEESLIQHEADFWHNHVLKKVPPVAITRSDILKKYPLSNQGKKMQANHEIQMLIQEMGYLQTEIKNLTEKFGGLRIKTQEAMQDSEFLIDHEDNVLVSWKTSKPRKRFDVKNFEKDHKALYEKYVTESSGNRSFLIKQKSK